MEITILKWDKYNPRKDIKHPSWFALSNRFLEDPDLFSFEPAELKAMLYLFCQASQKNSADISINFQHAERVCQIKNKDIRSAIEKLSVIGSVRVRTDHERARTQTSRDTTDTTDTTDKTLHTDTSTVVAVTTAPTAKAPGLGKLIEVDPKDERELLLLLPKETLERWGKLYPDAEFLNRELIKSFGYYRDNSTKAPKTRRGWSRALGSWFERSWPTHAARIKGVKPDDAKLAEWIRGEKPSSNFPTVLISSEVG